MKSIYFLLLILFNCLYLKSESGLDSLSLALQKTKITVQNIQNCLHQMQMVDPNEIDKIKLIGEWIIKNTDTDSLKEMQATANFVLGKVYTSTLSFEEATHYLTIALAAAEKNKFYTVEAQALNTLGYIYERNQQTEKAIAYYEKSLAISKANSYEKGIALATYSLGSAQLTTSIENTNRVIVAVNLMLQGFYITKKLKDTVNIIAQSSGLVGAYLTLKHYDSAFIVLNNAEKLIKATGKKVAYVRHYNRVAKFYNDKKNYSEAIKYYNTGLSLAKQYNVPRWLCMYYTGLSETYENMGDYKTANWYNHLNIEMHDALVSKENFAAAADIQNHYERVKKDNEILKLAAANKQKSTLNKIFIASTLGLLLIAFLGYVNFKSRSKIANQQQELQKQKIAELEKDKQLSAIDAMLKGQEEERSRIAKDLHDGVGSLLSGTKLSFMTVKENLTLTRDNSVLFDKSLSLLDNSIRDLRKVAHNLMPEALVKYGLKDALRDFCDSIQSSSNIKVIYQHFGENRKLNSTAEVFTYRIIQELVNNAMKHAEANQVIVQLSVSENKIEIAVEDDGKGFNKNEMMHKGAGMNNLTSRVQYFNGTFDIITSPGNGTSVNIELKA